MKIWPVISSTKFQFQFFLENSVTFCLFASIEALFKRGQRSLTWHQIDSNDRIDLVNYHNQSNNSIKMLPIILSTKFQFKIYN